MNIGASAGISGWKKFGNFINPFSGSMRFKLIKVFFAVSLIGGVANGIGTAVNPPKLNVNASCNEELEKCLLDIKGENVDFRKNSPKIEVPLQSGLQVELPQVLSRDHARAMVRFDNANAGRWDVTIDGIKYPQAIVLGE